MTIRKVASGQVNTTLANYVGEFGHLFYDPATGYLRVSDGHTPGGKQVILPDVASTTTLGVVKIGSGIDVDANGVITIDVATLNIEVAPDRLTNLNSTTTILLNNDGILQLGNAQNQYVNYGTTYLQIDTNDNTYSQVIWQNHSTGTNASMDLVLMNSTGDDFNHIVDLGINSLSYQQPQYSIYTPGSAYLYSQAADLFIGTAGHTDTLYFHAGGTTTTNSVGSFDQYGWTFNRQVVVSASKVGPLVFTNQNISTSSSATAVFQGENDNNSYFQLGINSTKNSNGNIKPSDVFLLAQGSGTALHVGGNTDLRFYADAINSNQGSPAVVLSATNKTLTINYPLHLTSGTTIFPNGGQIGGIYLPNAFEVYSSTATNFYVGLNYDNRAWMWIQANSDNSLYSAVSSINASGLAYSWYFNQLGALVYPDNTSQYTAYTGTVAWSNITGIPYDNDPYTTTATVASMISNSLTSYSTTVGVNTLIANSLTNYSTTTAVNALIASSLTNYATTTFVTSQGYVTSATSWSQDGYFRGPSGFGNIQLVSGGRLYINELAIQNTGKIYGPAGVLNLTLSNNGNVIVATTATVLGTAASTSTTTGALVVTGGVGIGGNLNVGQAIIFSSGYIIATGTNQTNATPIVYDNTYITGGAGGVILPVAQIGREISITNSSGVTVTVYPNTGGQIELLATNAGVTLPNNATLAVVAKSTTQWWATTYIFTAGSDITLTQTGSGSIGIADISTLQTVTTRGASTNQAVSITSTASSTSTLTGALLVTGGVGIGGNIYAGNIYSNGILVGSGNVTTATVNSLIASSLTNYITATAVSVLIGNSLTSYTTSTLVNGTWTAFLTSVGQLQLPVIVQGSTTGGTLVATGNVLLNANGNVWKFGSDGTMASPYNLVITTTGLQFPNGTQQTSAYTTATVNSLIGSSLTNYTTATAVNVLIGNSLTSYSTTVGVNTLIASSLTNYTTSTAVNVLIGNSLTSYSTTVGVNTLIANSLTNYTTSTAVNTLIGNSLTNYTTATAVNLLIRNSLTNFSGTITATAFAGDGSRLTNINFTNTNLVSGTQSNVTLVAGAYSFTLTNTGTIIMPGIQNLWINGSYPGGNFYINPIGPGDVFITTGTQLMVQDTSTSISTTTGALVVQGGAGIGQTLNVAGALNAGSNNTPLQHQLLSANQSPPTASSILTTASIAIGGAGGNFLAFGQYPSGYTLNGRSVQFGQWIQSGFSNNATPYPIIMNPVGGDVHMGGNLYVNGTLGVVTPNRPAFRVFGFGNTNNLGTTVNGNGILNYTNWSLDYQQGTALNTGTGVFTAPVAGLYQINLIVRTSSNTNNGIEQAIVMKNYTSGTSATLVMVEFASSTTVNHVGGSTVAKLNSGDTLVARVVSGTINFDGNDNWSVAYIG